MLFGKVDTLDSLAKGVGRSLLQSSSWGATGTTTERFGGVGAGVIVLAFFGVLFILLTCLGSYTDNGGAVCFGASALMAIIIVVLFAAPRKSEQSKLYHEIKGHDQSVVHRGLMMAVMCLGVVAALVAMLVNHIQPPLYARPLSIRQDIMRYR